MKSPFKKCPHCGSANGYYVRVHFQGHHDFAYNFNDSEHDDFRSDTYENAVETEADYTICIDCNKNLFPTAEN